MRHWVLATMIAGLLAMPRTAAADVQKIEATIGRLNEARMCFVMAKILQVVDNQFNGRESLRFDGREVANLVALLSVAAAIAWQSFRPSERFSEKIVLKVFAAIAALAGLAGAMIVPAFSMSADLGIRFLIEGFLAVMLGGIGTFEGPVAGGGIIGLMSSGFPWIVSPIFASISSVSAST